MLAVAHMVWASSTPLAARLSPRHADVRLLPNVADIRRFEEAASLPSPADMAAIPRPRILYLGNLAAYKIDFEKIARLAIARPDWHWVLIGPIGRGDPGTEIESLRRLANVHIMGERARSIAPAYAARADVCVLPLRDSASTRHSHPIKIYEYLAIGRPIVSAPIPSFGELADSKLIRTAESDEEWIASIEAGLRETDDQAPRRQAEARRHGWTARIEEIRDSISSARPNR